MICNIHSVKVQVLLRGEKRTKTKNKTHTHKKKQNKKAIYIYIYKSITKYIKTIVEFL